jgi:hypothetical protein
MRDWLPDVAPQPGRDQTPERPLHAETHGQELASIGTTLQMRVVIGALCDNYDRIGNVQHGLGTGRCGDL